LFSPHTQEGYETADFFRHPKIPFSGTLSSLSSPPPANSGAAIFFGHGGRRHGSFLSLPRGYPSGCISLFSSLCRKQPRCVTTFSSKEMEPTGLFPFPSRCVDNRRRFFFFFSSKRGLELPFPPPFIDDGLSITRLTFEERGWYRVFFLLQAQAFALSFQWLESHFFLAGGTFIQTSPFGCYPTTSREFPLSAHGGKVFFFSLRTGIGHAPRLARFQHASS